MQVREVTDKNVWESFFAQQEDKTFLQSWAWGEVQERVGNRIWRLGAYDGEGLMGVAMVTKVQAKRGTFVIGQHIVPMSKEGFVALLEEVKAIGAKEGASFLRLAPLWSKNEERERLLRELGFRQAPMHANAYESSWKLSLDRAEDELLAGMRKTTRYLIRQTIKNENIVVEQSAKKEDLETFAELNTQVGKRQQFVPFSRQFIEAEFDAFVKEDNARLFLGKYRGRVIAAALVIYWSGIGFYHQAASLEEYARFSVPYLAQWEAIKEAKRRGCKLYDFWGFVDPKKYPRHPWAGPTLFKMGFGGKAREYVKTQDYPLSWRYWPIAAFETIRKWRRGL